MREEPPALIARTPEPATQASLAAGLRTLGVAPGMVLMEKAGRAVADAVTARHPPGTAVANVAGPGNNGGDGFVAGRLLAARGYRVEILLLGDVRDDGSRTQCFRAIFVIQPAGHMI